MRRMLRILFWLGLGLSTILFVGTGVLWVRSVGHEETLCFRRFEANPDWNTGPLAGCGTLHSHYIKAIEGRLWLQSWRSVPTREAKLWTEYQRTTITSYEATREFEWWFHPGARPSEFNINQARRFAGVGFCHWESNLGSRIGAPLVVTFTLAIPFWLLAVIFGLWPVCFVARRVLRRRGYGPGLCPSCGYDLRATPDRCPECGRVMTGA